MENKFVVGFAFDDMETSVVLIRKARPDWQRGFINGVGGHIEKGETPAQAMNREWSEETNCDPVEWTLFAHLFGVNFEVWFFRGNTFVRNLESSSPGEELILCDPNDLPVNVISNLRWIIPMSRVSSAHDWPYEVEERSERSDPNGLVE